MTITAVLCYVTTRVRDSYLFQLHNVNSVLAEYPNIDKVWLVTNDDITLEVEQVYFSLIGQPRVTFTIDGTQDDTKSEIRRKMDHAMEDKIPVARPHYLTEHRR